jgi:hypothetical protein
MIFVQRKSTKIFIYYSHRYVTLLKIIRRLKLTGRPLHFPCRSFTSRIYICVRHSLYPHIVIAFAIELQSATITRNLLAVASDPSLVRFVRQALVLQICIVRIVNSITTPNSERYKPNIMKQDLTSSLLIIINLRYPAKMKGNRSVSVYIHVC